MLNSVSQCHWDKTICHLLRTLPLNIVLWGIGNLAFLVATTLNLLPKSNRSLWVGSVCSPRKTRHQWLRWTPYRHLPIIRRFLPIPFSVSFAQVWNNHVCRPLRNSISIQYCIPLQQWYLGLDLPCLNKFWSKSTGGNNYSMYSWRHTDLSVFCLWLSVLTAWLESPRG